MENSLSGATFGSVGTMDSLEGKIGYKFANSLLLAEAMTHPSLAYESRKPHFDNQRLEFLGDAVIQLVLTDELYRLFPKFSEGRLTKLRSRLVSRDALCRYANKLGLGEYLMLGKGEAASGGRDRPSNLADAFEALAGAIYLDGGFTPARKFMLENFQEFIEAIAAEPEEDNPKGELQEALQSISSSSPTYRIISQKGPDHLKKFVAEVTWEGFTLGKGNGTSKKEAETGAAIEALKSRNWEAHPHDARDRE
ncbi:MAG: ribonuclease III [Verrucomicrobiota bacterium]